MLSFRFARDAKSAIPAATHSVEMRSKGISDSAISHLLPILLIMVTGAMPSQFINNRSVLYGKIYKLCNPLL